MCLAIYKPAATRPDWDAYKNGHSQNDDSWGFAAVVNGSLVTRCGIGNFDEFREAFEPYSDAAAVIHFRWATHGKTDLHNCHPFMVSSDLAVIHNGIISIKCDLHAERSDTWHFNELVLKPMHARDPEFYKRNDVVYSQQLAHSGSKFIFLRADGDVCIWNEDDGDWERDGHWYSNDSHCGYRRFFAGGSTSTKPAVATIDTEREWLDEGDGKWRYAERASASTLTETRSHERDDEQEEQFYTDMRFDELIQYGFTRQCLREVFDVLGHYGIEVLHEAM